MGASGFSIAAHFAAAGEGALAAADSRARPPMLEKMSQLLPQVALFPGEDFSRWPARRFSEYERIALSPGVNPESVAAPAEKITGDAGLFFEAWRDLQTQTKTQTKTQLLAATGTNGKSATVTIAREICRAAGLRFDAVGNIGEPLLDALARWRREGFPDAAALELSSFQLETARAAPLRAAALLNVDDDHLDRHGDIHRYAAIKSRIFGGADICVANGDDAIVSAMPACGRRVVFSLCDLRADWRMRGGVIEGPRAEYPLAEISESAREQPANVMAALALADSLDAAREPEWQKSAAAALAGFSGLPHRRREVLRRGGVLFVDDSKATNAHAACFALRAQKENSVALIAGGDGKGQDFSSLVDAARGRVFFAALIGRDAARLRDVFSRAGARTAMAEDMQEAVRLAAEAARPGATVLLSPACSSLDMFADYRARAEAFRAAAEELPETVANVSAAAAEGNNAAA